MFTISARAIVDAPAEVVWKVIIDFAAYKQWSTMLLPQQNTAPVLGETIKLRLALPDGPNYTFEPVIITLDDNHHFAWRQKPG